MTNSAKRGLSLPQPFRTDKNNFSPRLGLAWSPSSEWVVRAGFGLYYDRLPLASLNRALQKDGVRAFPLVSRPLGFARNALSTPRFINFDLHALKYFPFGEKRKLDLVVEFFNLFNHPNVASINSFFGSGVAPLSTFSTPTAFASPRQVRFSIDFEF